MADNDEDTIERAVSNRSRCKGCGVAIDKDELRFGAADLELMIRPHTYYHLRCARDAMPERFAAAAAAVNLPDDAVPPAPDAGLSILMSIERSPSARARCQQCKVAIATGALRVIVRLELDPEEAAKLAAEGYPTYRQGFIHIGCAAAMTKGADGIDDYLAKRATKQDHEAVVNYARAKKLLDGEPELVAAGEPSVVGDWLEAKHAIVIAEPDLAQLIGVPAPSSAKKKSSARTATPKPKTEAETKPKAEKSETKPKVEKTEQAKVEKPTAKVEKPKTEKPTAKVEKPTSKPKIEKPTSKVEKPTAKVEKPKTEKVPKTKKASSARPKAAAKTPRKTKAKVAKPKPKKRGR